MKDNGRPTPASGLLAYREAGADDKPVLVLLHGFGGSGHHFDSILEPLSAAAHVVLPDLPGHGQSRDFAGSRHPRAAAEAVLATLSAMGCERFHLAGFSLGGAVSSLIALQAPERILSLTLLAPGGFGAEIAAETLRTFAAADTADTLRAAAQGMMGPGATLPEAELDQLLHEREDEALREALIAIAAMITKDGRQGAIPRSDLARISCPVRIVWGTQDPVLPVSQSRDLPPQFDLRLVPGAGHMLVHEARDAVIETLLASVTA